jgi:glutaminyl-peptide cyclotransferase
MRAFAVCGLLALSSLLTSGCGRREKPVAGAPSPDSREGKDPAGGGAASSSIALPKPGFRNAGPAGLKPGELSEESAKVVLWDAYSGERALEAVARQVQYGARPSGSAALEKCRGGIILALEESGWEVEQQVFTDETPRGTVRFVNLVARFRGGAGKTAPRDTQRAVVGSHYDTKRFSTIEFVGACDGASSTGALIELARVLALRPDLAAKVELVFFDGEEAVVQFTETDGLYGSRRYARGLRESGRARQFRFGLVWDMIGDRDLTLTLSPDSPQPLTRDLLVSAEALRVHSHFSYFDRSILDDHVPLNQAGIPTVDLIDFEYLPWHTADDTLDKLSAASLKKVGALTLHFLQKSL